MRLNPARRVLIVVFFITGSMAMRSTMAQSPPPPVVWQESKLSVHFENAPISQILDAVASATRIKLSVDPSVASYQESVSFKRLPLREALLKILDGSEIDFIIVGDPNSSQAVTQVYLLGFSPKGPLTSSVPASFPTQVYPNQPVNPFSSNVPPNTFSGQTLTEQPVPGRNPESGRFLPFPEANSNLDSGSQIQAPQRLIPPNPFNPEPAVNPNNPPTPPPPFRRDRRNGPTWPPERP